MLNEQLQNELDQEAKAEAKKITARVPIFRMGYEAGYYDGAEKYTEKLQAAEAKSKQLEQWKTEAAMLLDPLLTWGQAQKDMPLGCDITKEILRRAKLFEAYEKALKIIQAWQLPPTGQFWDIDKTQPMSYAACYGSNGERDFIRNVANEALTPKTSNDEQ